MSENFNTQNENLLRRAYLFLEDKEWEKANEYAEKVLDNDPESSDAYLCKLLSEFRVARKESLANISEEISQSKNYANALKFANASQKEFLEDCAEKTHTLFCERERAESHQKAVKTFSDTIDTLRETKRSNCEMIKRGKNVATCYLVFYIICVIYLATIIIVATALRKAGKDDVVGVILGLGLGLGTSGIFTGLWIGHARLARFWDINYGDDRGWIFPVFFGMLNALFMLGIWGLVKTVKTYKECKALNANNEQADRLISDYQQNLEREKNESD